MGLLTGLNGELFTQEWVDANRGVPESGMNCQIKIERLTGRGTGEWNPETGTYTGMTLSTILTSKARIQPLRSAVPKEVPGNDTITQTMLISYPVSETASIHVEDIVKVTSSPLNADLLRYRMRVREVLDSGNILERTIQCEVTVVI